MPPDVAQRIRPRRADSGNERQEWVRAGHRRWRRHGPDTLALSIHGGKTEDQRLLVNGVALSTMIGGGWGGGAIPNMSGQSEVAYDFSAVDATISTGGVRINFIPRDGGNRFSGTIAANIATDGMQPDTFVTSPAGP